jgi:hypothetical protein
MFCITVTILLIVDTEQGVNVLRTKDLGVASTGLQLKQTKLCRTSRTLGGVVEKFFFPFFCL